MWRKGGGLPLQCLCWTSFGSQEGNNSSTFGFIAKPRVRGCLSPDFDTDSQRARLQNAECSHEEPKELWRLTAKGRLRNEYTGFCASVVEAAEERIWVAMHSSGKEYYVASFNLGSNDTHISVGIDTVIRRLMPSTKTGEVLRRMASDASTYLHRRLDMLSWQRKLDLQGLRCVE